ncbi:hypothetical protein AB0B30_38370 [Streptomyces narbonensis]|uniref:Uncharacterized protein n=1 Tax=Streptomyces narbonensis TaxID=67333 RepID=A0ABV3CMI8_9ACTN
MVQLFFTGRRNALGVGNVAGIDGFALEELLDRTRLPAGTPAAARSGGTISATGRPRCETASSTYAC